MVGIKSFMFYIFLVWHDSLLWLICDPTPLHTGAMLILKCFYIHYIHTYHSRFIPKGVAEVFQIFFRDTHVLPMLAMRNTADVTGGKPIAVSLQSISGVSAINPLVAFYDIHGGKREVLFFYFVPDTTRDSVKVKVLKCFSPILCMLYTWGARWSSGQCAQRAIAEAKHRT
jgi:hypothetical protein